MIWIKLPVLCAIFLSSPWILLQVWGFISPGLYRRERRWAAPFVIGSAGLFILGGLFAYFVAFRFGLTFLLGIGRGNYVKPMVSISPVPWSPSRICECILGGDSFHAQRCQVILPLPAIGSGRSKSKAHS